MPKGKAQIKKSVWRVHPKFIPETRKRTSWESKKLKNSVVLFADYFDSSINSRLPVYLVIKVIDFKIVPPAKPETDGLLSCLAGK